jgi:hypothetical protein
MSRHLSVEILMKARRLLPLLATASLMAACATPEYHAAADECRGPAQQTYPVVMQQQMVRNSREVLVPDGSTICETIEVKNGDKESGFKQTRTVCRPGMRKAIEYYDEPRMVDLNQGGRDAYVRQCARNLCQQRYGNLDCKTGK